MLVWTITPEGSDDSEPLVVENADAEPLQDIVLVDEDHLLADRLCCVQIMMVDWASVFEIEAIVVESVSPDVRFISVALVFDCPATGRVYRALPLRYTTSVEGVIDR